MTLIEGIRDPRDVRALAPEQLPALAAEIRSFLVEKVSAHRRPPRPQPRRRRAHDRPAPGVPLARRHDRLRHRPPGLRAQDPHRPRGGLRPAAPARAACPGYPSRAESRRTTSSRTRTPRRRCPRPTASPRPASVAASSDRARRRRHRRRRAHRRHGLGGAEQHRRRPTARSSSSSTTTGAPTRRPSAASPTTSRPCAPRAATSSSSTGASACCSARPVVGEPRLRARCTA